MVTIETLSQLASPRRGPFGLATLLGKSGATSRLRGRSISEDALVVHGDPRRFRPFSGIAAVESADALLDAWDGKQMLRAWCVAPEMGSSPRELFPSKRQARALYYGGFNMLFQRIERFIPELDRLCRLLDADLDAPAGTFFAEAFIAARGAGAWPHFDSNITLNCQVLGEKTWWLADNPAIRVPPTGMSLRLPAPSALAPLLSHSQHPMPKKMPEGARSFTARPGTAVFIPPGTLHATQVTNESMAILFTLDPTTLADRVAAIAKQRLRAISDLRNPRNAAISSSSSSAKAARELRRLADALETRALAL